MNIADERTSRGKKARRAGVARTCALVLALVGAGACSQLAFAAEPLPLPAKASRVAGEPVPIRRADFEQERASADARQTADWIVDSGDNQGKPFVLVDKVDARVFVFHADGRLRGAAPALLGLAVGDEAVPGIGERPLSSIRPDERTTPAGRFVSSLGRNLHGADILWVDYAGAVSMHPVITANPKELRAQRLATPTPLDNRISFGCINVPAVFFRNVVSVAFKGTDGIVYVLPETRSARHFFAPPGVGDRIVQQSLAAPSAPNPLDAGFAGR
jgi:hypothetical protein